MTSPRISSGSPAKPPRTLPSPTTQLFHPSDSSRKVGKRKRSNWEDGHVPDEEGLIRSKGKKSEAPMTSIRPPSFVYPKTAYNGHVPSMPRYSEKSVLQDILAKEQERENSDTDTNGDAFVEADLQDFVIYRPHKPQRHIESNATEFPLANELVSLHEINEHGVKHFYFDGVICYAGRQRYLQKVPFEILSIGGYEEPERSTVGPYIWIQSIEGTNFDVWYRLKNSAVEYKRYHEPFLWMADLAKHLVDYLQAHNVIALSHFRHCFYDWLQDLYATDRCFRRWLEQYGDKDFRRVVAAQANFLYFQAIQVDQKYEKHPIWEEVHSRILRAIPEQVENITNQEMLATLTERDEFTSRRKTTVTPYVFNCLERLPWAKFLYCQSSSNSGVHHRQKNLPVSHMRSNYKNQVPVVRIPLGRKSIDLKAREEPIHVSVGDVVAIPKDHNSAWKTDDAEYLGYVQDISDTDKGQALGLLWFYRPGDTTCQKMFYPYSQELFLGDHCNCGDPAVLASEVIRKPQVAFYSGPETPYTDFFCRQRYVGGDGAWITLQDSHFRCACNVVPETPKYCVGDTLLVASSLRRSDKNLEPVVLLEHYPDSLDEKIRVTRLLRRGRDSTVATTLLRTNDVKFDSTQKRKKNKEEYRVLTIAKKPWPSFINQGWDPTSTPPQRIMKGLDLFCGGGNFGRGLEEGGAVRFDWAVDWYNQAIHTYKANLPTQNQTKLFRGSVNHYLSQALEGKRGNLIAQLGEVEVICAGSPCQGSSLANPKRRNDRGLLNESMVASVLAFIDFYRPKYALMENVKGMALGDEKLNVLAQVVCCLVGMGYQVRTSCLDAWSFGSPQKRSRVIITIAAPGLTPLSEPAQTHSHPDEVWGGSLGKTANGVRTASRTTDRTPFEYVTSSEATKDLPSTDARTVCIPFPDHRMSRNLPIVNWVRVSCVPRFPGGNSFIKAFKQGYMPQAQIQSFKWNFEIRSRDGSRSWQRVKRNALMPTVMTEPRPDDGGGGTCLHWDDHRLLTIMEARRGQGFPDREVLIGSPLEQWKIIGNSVARPMALALGVSLRTAWLANTATQKAQALPVEASSKNIVNGSDDDDTTKRPKLTPPGEDARNEWSAKDMLNKLTAALTSPRALVSALSETTKEPLTNGNHHFTTTSNFQPSKYIDSVKACDAGLD